MCTFILIETNSLVLLIVVIASCVLSQIYQPYQQPYQQQYQPQPQPQPYQADNIFRGCDFSEQILENRVYDIFPLSYPEKYAPGTNCRWSGCAPLGHVLVIKCNDMQIPTVIITYAVFPKL